MNKLVPFKYKVYQANIKCPWTFMNKEFAKTHGLTDWKAFEDNYSLVADTSIMHDPYDENYQTNILNDIWEEGNNGTLTSNFQMRSISVSDVIYLEGKYYYVNPWGFTEL